MGLTHGSFVLSPLSLWGSDRCGGGSSFCGRPLLLWGRLVVLHFGLCCLRRTFGIQVDASHLLDFRAQLLGHYCFHHFGFGLGRRCRTLLLLPALQHFLGLVAQVLVCAELLLQQFILPFVELLVGVARYGVTLFVQEVGQRLESYTEFFDGFI